MTDTHTTIADALFTKTQQQVLKLLFGKPDQSFYTKEIARLAGVGMGTVQRELLRLSESGVITIALKGNQKHYQANPACPVFEELRGIVVKTFGVADVVREALLPFTKRIKVAFIYGSMAKGGVASSSDVDLMLIGSGLSYSSIIEALSVVEQQLGRPVNPTLYTPVELKRKLEEGNAFLQRVLQQPKIMLMGEMDDIGELAESGQDKSA